MKRWIVAGLIVACSAAPVAAQDVRHEGFGVEGIWGSDSDFGVGARGEFDLHGALGSGSSIFSHAFIAATFDYFFPDCGGADCSWWEINPSLAVPLTVKSKLEPYVGAGLNIAHVSADLGSGFGSASNTDTGLNLLGGIRFPIAKQSGFAEARMASGGSDQFTLTVGILLGGH